LKLEVWLNWQRACLSSTSSWIQQRKEGKMCDMCNG
jgi:hypothetical protein